MLAAIRECFSTIPLMPKMANRTRSVAFGEDLWNWSRLAEGREGWRCSGLYGNGGTMNVF